MTNDQSAPAVPIQSPADAAGPGVADYAGVIEELRRLRDEAQMSTKDTRLDQAQQAYHLGRRVAYSKTLRLLSCEDKPEPISSGRTAQQQDK